MMKDKILRKLFLGFIQIHILRHASQSPFFGAWLMDHLQAHGYRVSPGMLYPLLHRMETDELIKMEVQVAEGRQRKFYRITPLGREVLDEANYKITELSHRMND
ncbi:hypothetical protein CI610_02921 [invertebrate metagenome]|uniref:Transcription regulator PadR N-terminal domain-containing protein n=1 Tax=invertebrate metagenome TaxID=1711999 RepID=A0A2H9T4J2_9ZZZZ